MNNFPKTCNYCKGYVAFSNNEWKKHRKEQHNIGGGFKFDLKTGTKLNVCKICNCCGIEHDPVTEFDDPKRGTVYLCNFCISSRNSKKVGKRPFQAGGYGTNRRY